VKKAVTAGIAVGRRLVSRRVGIAAALLLSAAAALAQVSFNDFGRFSDRRSYFR